MSSGRCLVYLTFPLLLILMSSSLAFSEDNDWHYDKTKSCKVFLPGLEPDHEFDYIGDCRDGLAEGRATLIWFKGSQPLKFKTEQTFSRGKGIQPVTATTDSGVVVEGNVQGGHFNQTAVIKFPSGTIYTGKVRDGVPDFEGKYVFPNGTTYTGYIRDAKAFGHGVFTAEGGKRYDGAWLNGSPQGYGTLEINGAEYSGIWIAGCFQDPDRKMSFMNPRPCP